MPLLNKRQRCSSNLNLASSGSFTVAGLHNLSEIALRRGHRLESKFPPSTQDLISNTHNQRRHKNAIAFFRTFFKKVAFLAYFPNFLPILSK